MVWNKSGNDGGRQNYLESEYNLKADVTEFANGMGEEHDRMKEVKKHVKIFHLSNEINRGAVY